MSKKFKWTVISLLMSLCLASVGFAWDYGESAYWLSPIPYSGLVLNPEGKGDLLIFPYYDVRPILKVTDEGEVSTSQDTLSPSSMNVRLAVTKGSSLSSVSENGIRAKRSSTPTSGFQIVMCGWVF